MIKDSKKNTYHEYLKKNSNFRNDYLADDMGAYGDDLGGEAAEGNEANENGE